MIDIKNFVLKRIIKTGMIIPFAADNILKIPSGFLVCDGSAVLRSLYSSLFNTIGVDYGAGDGATTFNLPDLSTFYLLNGLNVNTPAQNCRGNGLTMGFTNGVTGVGLCGGDAGHVFDASILYGTGVGAGSTAAYGVWSSLGLTSDATYSGVMRDAVTSTVSNKIKVYGIIKY